MRNCEPKAGYKNKWQFFVPEKRLAEKCQGLVLFKTDIGSLERGMGVRK